MIYSFGKTVLLLFPSFYLGGLYLETSTLVAKSESEKKKIEGSMRSYRKQLAEARSVLQMKIAKIEVMQRNLNYAVTALKQLEDKQTSIQYMTNSVKSQLAQIRSVLQVKIVNTEEMQESVYYTFKILEHEKEKLQFAYNEAVEKEKIWNQEKESLKSSESQYKSKLQETTEQLRQLKHHFAAKEKELNQTRFSLLFYGLIFKANLQEISKKLKLRNSKNEQEAQTLISAFPGNERQSKMMLPWTAHSLKQIRQQTRYLDFCCPRISELRKQWAIRANFIEKLLQQDIGLQTSEDRLRRLVESQFSQLKSQISQLKSQREKEQKAAQEDINALKDKLQKSEEETAEWRVRFGEISRKYEELKNTVEAKERERESLTQQLQDALLKVKHTSQVMAEASQQMATTLQLSKGTSQQMTTTLHLTKETSQQMETSLHLTKEISQQMETSLELTKETFQQMETSLQLTKEVSKQMETSLQLTKEAALQLECVICNDRRKEMLFEPCCHFAMCEKCSSSQTRCPICRRSIQTRKIVYLS